MISWSLLFVAIGGVVAQRPYPLHVKDMLRELGRPDLASVFAENEITDRNVHLLDRRMMASLSFSAGAQLEIEDYLAQKKAEASSASREGEVLQQPRRATELPSSVSGASAWFKADGSKLIFGALADVSLSRVGAGHLATSGALTVGGAFRVGTDADATCDANAAGTLRWNAADAKLELCGGDAEWGGVGGAQIGEDNEPCNADKAGALRFQGGAFGACDGTEWFTLLGQPTLQPTRSPTRPPYGWSATNPGETCNEILQRGNSKGDGAYFIDLGAAGDGTVFEAYCDMTSGGGGWTLCAQQRQDSNQKQIWESDALQQPSTGAGGAGPAWSGCKRLDNSAGDYAKEVLFKVYDSYADEEDAPYGAYSVTWGVAFAQSSYPGEFTGTCHKCDDAAFRARAAKSFTTGTNMMYVEHHAFDGLGIAWDPSETAWHTSATTQEVMVGSPLYGCAEYWSGSPGRYHSTYHAFGLFSKGANSCASVSFTTGLSSSNRDGKTSVYVRY